MLVLVLVPVLVLVRLLALVVEELVVVVARDIVDLQKQHVKIDLQVLGVE